MEGPPRQLLEAVAEDVAGGILLRHPQACGGTAPAWVIAPIICLSVVRIGPLIGRADVYTYAVLVCVHLSSSAFESDSGIDEDLESQSLTVALRRHQPRQHRDADADAGAGVKGLRAAGEATCSSDGRARFAGRGAQSSLCKLSCADDGHSAADCCGAGCGSAERRIEVLRTACRDRDHENAGGLLVMHRRKPFELMAGGTTQPPPSA